MTTNPSSARASGRIVASAALAAILAKALILALLNASGASAWVLYGASR